MKSISEYTDRRIDYLRISVTDRCNLRCVYCMPPQGVLCKSHEKILSYEQIAHFARVAVRAGISKVRLTGGEPLVRKGIVSLIRYLKAVPDLHDISMTTNGILFPDYAEELKEAGLRRINISIDSLDADVYERMTRGGNLDDALKAVESAISLGFSPVKVNAVIISGVNEEVERFLDFVRLYPVHVRFIEYMAAGASAEMNYLSNDEVAERLKARINLTPALSPEGSGPARYYTFNGARGTIGFISPVSRHFCDSCSRLRLSADGKLLTCLYSPEELDVSGLLDKKDEEHLFTVLVEAQKRKTASHGGAQSSLQGVEQSSPQSGIQSTLPRRMFRVGG
ncbi:MAG: GTP 3',8-cyclase MoaA [Vulcanimicrobiota bacterium]